MFKKPFSINTTHKVSGADRKKLRRSLLDKVLGHLSDAEQREAVLDAVLPSKAGDLEVSKLVGSRLVLYLLDGLPIIIDPSGKGDLLPSVHALWASPNLLPKVYLKHPAVSQYIVGGADLMLPGVNIDMEFPSFKKGDPLSVNVHGQVPSLHCYAASMHLGIRPTLH